MNKMAAKIAMLSSLIGPMWAASWYNSFGDYNSRRAFYYISGLSKNERRKLRKGS